MLKAKDLRNENLDELKAKVFTLRQEVYELRGGNERKREKPHLIAQKRKDIAKILTVLREKEDGKNG